MPAALKIEFLAEKDISSDLRHAIDALVHLAFHADSSEESTGKSNDEGVPASGIGWQDIHWGPLEWMALGRVDGELVAILGMLRRVIRVGEEPLWVVGVGCVATHPAWQRRGLSSRLLLASKNFMRENLPASFGLLICGDDRLSFYERVGWRHAADDLFFTQDGNRYPIYQLPVMILPLSRQDWPSGEIDLCGSPW